ncbi:MAG: ABC transporter ATP-binding protein [Lachnospiraceae bacterium]
MSTIKTLAAYVKEFKRDSIITPICMALEVVMEMIIPLLMARIVDEGIMAGNMSVIYQTGAWMVLCACVSLSAGFGGGFFGARASTGFARNLREAMYNNIQTFSFANIDKFSTAGLVTRLTTDVTNVQNAYQMILRITVRAPFTLIAAMFLSFLISPPIASIFLVVVLILGFLLFFIASRTMKTFRRIFKTYDALNESVQENVSAIRVVKANVREDYEIKKFKKTSGLVHDLFSKAERVLAINSPAMSTAIYTTILLISYIGAKMIVSDTLTTGNLMSLLTYCMNILTSLMMVSMIFVMITMSAASAERIAEVLNEKSSLTNPENPVETVPDGSIRFDHVSFRYNPNSPRPVLDDVSLDIRSGETVGILGATGSAKSTLVSLIPRLYDVSSGSISVGGLDVRKYDMEALRNQVSMVLQKNELFSGTIYDNLRWGNEQATDEQCQEACRLACADEFIEKFPDGYNTWIDQGGTNVSGGQKQRLCIARALLKNPKILILDDSTSAVDTATDAKIRKAFREERPDVTKLIIAQRIASVEDADRVIIMDEGRIAAFDTPENLLANNKIYQEIYTEQKTGGSGDFDEKGGED